MPVMGMTPEKGLWKLVVSPDVFDLPFVTEDGVKCFELRAESVNQEILPGLFIRGWGYNGSIPGPTIQVYPGDSVCFRVRNMLPEPTSVHWHGLNVSNVMDGVPDVEPSPRIEPGQFFDYRFQITNPPGTHMYHTHHNVAEQEMMGLGGGLIILDPPHSLFGNVDRDYFIMLQEFSVVGLEHGEIKPGVFDVDPYSHDFSFFTMNGRSFPYTTPLTVRAGERARVRLGNIAELAHPIHIHGHQFEVVASDGNSISPENRMLQNTIHVASGETRDVEFLADNPGIWPFHCHIPHHMSNNMTKETGGMFTTILYQCNRF